MPPEILGLLEDINEAIGFIVDDTDGLTFDKFVRDRRTRQLVERNFEIIGEAVNRLRRRAPHVADRISASRQIIDVRNAVAHGYDVIDYAAVWRTIHESLPLLRHEVEELLREPEHSTSSGDNTAY